MSADDIAVLQAAVNCWPDHPRTSGNADLSDAARRCLAALEGLAAGTARAGDVATLIRQVLLTSAVRFDGSLAISVPTSDPWPTESVWEQHWCEAWGADGRLLVRAMPWYPGCTSDPAGGIDEMALQEVMACYGQSPVAELELLDADPFWQQATGMSKYRGASQQQSARAVALSRQGARLIVALPTGRGKTALGWVRPMLAGSGVSVVVVPTVVLAIDMERRTREHAAKTGLQLSPVDTYAYTGSLDEATKQDLRAAVRAGTQRVIYTSPEAFVSGLAGSVIACATAGLLRQVVIDEAHLVDQWGQDFRPEFQTMAGLIAAAHDRSPDGARPVVLMLSATLAQRHIEILETMFGDVGNPADLMWGTSLRPEPAYFVTASQSQEEKHDGVLQAVRCLPKPMILYTTEVADAKEWRRSLADEGICRVGLVTGESSEDERRTVFDQWRGLAAGGAEYDVVVGTSAFGLGIDMPNVRTVLHACVPETIDRYYQEVGRAGRDRRPSVAALYFTERDRRVARDLNNKVLIGPDKGWARWSALHQTAEPIGAASYRVRLSALPWHLPEGFGQSVQWNMRTLNLMTQAGMIRLRAPALGERPTGVNDEQWREVCEAFAANVRDCIDFDLLDGRHLTEIGWKSATASTRAQIADAQHAALSAMVAVLQGELCTGTVIARHYRIARSGGHLIPRASCRGCPWCRAHSESKIGLDVLEPAPALPDTVQVNDPLSGWRHRTALVYVWWNDEQKRQDLLPQALSGLAQRGVNVFSGIDHAMGAMLQKAASPHAVVRLGDSSGWEGMHAYPGPIVHVHRGGALPREIADRINYGQPTYLFAPGTWDDPRKPGWQMRDTADCSVGLPALLEEL